MTHNYLKTGAKIFPKTDIMLLIMDNVHHNTTTRYQLLSQTYKVSANVTNPRGISHCHKPTRYQSLSQAYKVSVTVTNLQSISHCHKPKKNRNLFNNSFKII